MKQNRAKPSGILQFRTDGQPIQNRNKLPGRNDPCICSSGQKFKLCCARKIEAEAERIRVAKAAGFIAGVDTGVSVGVTPEAV